MVTNQITTRFNAINKHGEELEDLDNGDLEPDDDGSSHVMAALGNTWSHAVNTRLILQYLDDVYRQVFRSITARSDWFKAM